MHDPFDVEKRSISSAQDFARAVAARRPLIVTNLFENQPLRSIRTKEEAEAKFGAISLQVRDEPFTATMRSLSAQPPKNPVEHMTLSQYLRYVDANPRTTLMCYEQQSPPVVRETYAIPDWYPSEEAALSLMFVGNKGTLAPCHYDKDARHGILYQIYGAKRVLLIPTEQSKKLFPYNNHASTYLANFSEGDRADFLRYAKGWELVIRPGEAVLIPALMWHHIDYIDDCMSVSLDFGRNQFVRPILNKYVPVDSLSANVLARFSDVEDMSGPLLAAYEELKAVVLASTAPEQDPEIARVVRRLYAQICPNAIQGMYGPDIEWLISLDPKKIAEMTKEAPTLETTRDVRYA